MKALLIALLALATTTPAFADKILSPGQTYTARKAGEIVACTGDTQPSVPQSYVFNAEGEAFISDQEANQANPCIGVGGGAYGAMLNAKEVAASNCVNIQCPEGYTCAVSNGAMQYRPRGRICRAYLPCRATRN